MKKLLSLTFIILYYLTIFAQTPCVDGFAGAYPCDNIDLQSHLPISDLRGSVNSSSSVQVNDIWGWTDSLTEKEYALVGLTNGVAFVDISDPIAPTLIGNLPRRDTSLFLRSWRDVKVFNNHAYVVSEDSNHGIQTFDLTRLRNVANPPITFDEDGTADFVGGNVHNVIVNEETAYVYTCGTRTYGNGGLAFFNVSDPKNPVAEGYFEQDGYTHDAICFIYKGTDKNYIGKEICIGFNEDTYTIVDVTDKSDPTQISRTPYSGYEYTHQGWITDDHRYLLLNDELDESRKGHNTKTYIFDLTDLDAPTFVNTFINTTEAIDHNLYVKGSHVYQSNYRSGLRILELDEIAAGNLEEVAYFDVYPANDGRGYNGAWSNYPYFKSGNILISGIEQGLFVVKPNLPHFVISQPFPSVVEVCQGASVAVPLELTAYYGFTDSVTLSIPQLPADLNVSFSGTKVLPNETVEIFVSLVPTATEENYSLLVKGVGNNPNTSEQIAIGVKAIACPSLTVEVKVLLEGGYNSSQGLLNGKYQSFEILPKVEPFTRAEEQIIQNFKAQIDATYYDQTGPDAAQDWVIVELKSDANTVVASRAAVLQRDGDVVDTDGSSPVVFTGVEAGNYYLNIKHRNHGEIMTENPVLFTN